MKLTLPQKVLVVYLLVLAVYWIFLARSGLQTGSWNYLYSFLFGLAPLFGGLIGVDISKSWGMFGSAMGRAVLYISVGLFSWGVGESIWSYYNFFLNQSAPYPSLADGGFIVALPFWIIGIIELSKATGARFALQNLKSRIFLVLAPLVIIGVSYYLLVTVARGGVLFTPNGNWLKLFFDIAYPTGDLFILTLAVVIFGLSFKYFGGMFKTSAIILLIGFAVMYVADFTFSYTTTLSTFYNGDLGDMIFTLALFIMTFGILGFGNSLKVRGGEVA